MRTNGKKTLGIAFGGGAARGFAHVGVIKVLEEAGIYADFVSGTSAGSLIAALYCDGYSYSRLFEITSKIRWKHLLTFRFGKGGMFLTDKMETLIDSLLGGKRFEDLCVPLRVTAVDVNSGEQVVLREGPVAKAVRASSTVPGVFIPMEYEGKLLIDGGMVNSLPGDVVKEMGADIVLGINLNGGRVGDRSVKRTMSIVKKTFNIIVNNNLQMGKRYVDLMVEPAIEEFSYSSLRSRFTLIERGEEAMREALPRLEEMLNAVHLY